MGDTRQDFEELGGRHRRRTVPEGGNEPEKARIFYYMHTLIEVIADDPDTLEQRVTAVRPCA